MTFGYKKPYLFKIVEVIDDKDIQISLHRHFGKAAKKVRQLALKNKQKMYEIIHMYPKKGMPYRWDINKKILKVA